MNAVSRVAAVGSARLSAPVYRVLSPGAAVRPAQRTKSSGAVRQTAVQSPTQSTQSAGQPDLPVGLLQSVVQPSSGNFQANLDYQDLRTALDIGNLTAAQQAYLRLQSDLYLPQLNVAA